MVIYFIVDAVNCLDIAIIKMIVSMIKSYECCLSLLTRKIFRPHSPIRMQVGYCFRRIC